VAGLRWRIVMAAIGSTLITGTLGHGLAGRSLRPARLAMAQQRDFIADAAHELRTPLAVIQASAGHTLSRERGGEEYREALSEILTATTRAGAKTSSSTSWTMVLVSMRACCRLSLTDSVAATAWGRAVWAWRSPRGSSKPTTPPSPPPTTTGAAHW